MKFTKEQIYKYGMRDVFGFEGRYAITSCGRVWSYRSGRFLTPKLDKDGYFQIGLYDEYGKQHWYFVSRLMGLTYLENPDNLPEVAHKNECQKDNYLSNLEWSSHLDNCNTPLHKKRIANKNTNRSNKVRCIETNTIYGSRKEAEEITGIDGSSIAKCCNGKRATAGGYHWEYIS